MKNIIFILLACFTLSTFAQKSPVDKFLKKYDWDNGLVMKEMKPGSEEFSDEFKLNGQAISELLEKVEKLTIINGDSSSLPSTRNAFYNDAFEVLKDDGYTNIVQVNSDDGDKVGIYTSLHKNGNIKEVVFLLLEENNLLMMVVKADLDLSELGLGDIIKCLEKDHSDKKCKKDHDHKHGQDCGD